MRDYHFNFYAKTGFILRFVVSFFADAYNYNITKTFF